jgi:8-oxo-dGTP pyrophosphatase MutT (NUDIX family)
MWQPDVTVAALCESEGRFLVVEERSKSNGKIVLNQPAGHLEDGESLLDAVVRETLEETRCHFSPEHLLGLYRLRTPQGKTYLRYTFIGTVGDPDPQRELDPDIIRTHWLSRAELVEKQNLRSELVLSCIDDYLAGERYSLKLLRELS